MLLAAAAAFSMPFLGVRNFVRGHAPDEGGKYVGDIFLVIGGVAVGIGIALFLGILLGGKDAVSMFSSATVLTIGLAAMGGATGSIVGLFQRPGTQRRFAIAMANEAFLDSRGFVETGENEITHFDGEGNALRLTERTPTSIVFMAVGKRNKRAYIGLSPAGEMQNYSGVVNLGSARDMDSAA